MMCLCRFPNRSNRLGTLLLWGALALTAAGCASGGKGGWFRSKEPEPPKTIADFMKQPRPK